MRIILPFESRLASSRNIFGLGDGQVENQVVSLLAVLGARRISKCFRGMRRNVDTKDRQTRNLTGERFGKKHNPHFMDGRFDNCRKCLSKVTLNASRSIELDAGIL